MLFTLYSLKRLPGGNETVGNTIFRLKCGFLYKKKNASKIVNLQVFSSSLVWWNMGQTLSLSLSLAHRSQTKLLLSSCTTAASQNKEQATTHQHSKDWETPFPVYMGMAVYAKTRKRNLVEMLHDHGMSISYDRVLEISAQLGDASVRK